MKRIIDVINVILVIIIVLVLIYTPSVLDNDKKVVIKTDNDIKEIDTDVLMRVNNEVEVIDEELEKEEEITEELELEESVEDEENNSIVEDAPVSVPEEVIPEIETPSVVVPPVTTPSIISTHVGSMSGYGPDCYGCSGTGGTASGWNAYTDGIYYNDSTYGGVRVVAGDRSLPFGSIIKVNNSRLGTFYAIVLDRGGVVGFDTSDKHMFDLLFNSNAEALAAGTSYGVVFEVLRLGY